MQALKFLGFTLAEVLITLGIIGIVASMTIPTLITNAKDRELKSAWKKQYSVLSQAFAQVAADYGGSIVGVYQTNTGTEAFKNDMKEKLSYVKDCGGTAAAGGSGLGASAEGCWHAANNYYFLNGNAGVNNSVSPGLILKDGALMFFSIANSDCNLSTAAYGGTYTRCGWINLDVNGVKKPNVWGKDLFGISITGTILVPFGAKGLVDWQTTCLDESDPSFKTNPNTGEGCAAKYLME